MKQAVCVLIEHPVTGRVLAVSRRDDLSNWCLPGGKVEPGESLATAAKRELREETGLYLYSWDVLEPYHQRECLGDDDYFCTVFRMDSPSERILNFAFTDSKEGKVEWRQWGDLVADTASFRVYNWELMLKLNKDDHVANTRVA